MHRKGVALIIAIAMLLVVSAIQVAYIALYYNNYRLADKLVKKVQAHYKCRAIEAWAMDHVYQNSIDATIDLSYFSGEINDVITIDDFVGQIYAGDVYQDTDDLDDPNQTKKGLIIWSRVTEQIPNGTIKGESKTVLFARYVDVDGDDILGSGEEFEKIFWQQLDPGVDVAIEF